VRQNYSTVMVETSDHVELQFRLAGIGTRLLAYLVDRLIQAGLIFALLLVVGLLLYVGGKLFAVSDLLQGLQQALGQWTLALAILLYGVISIGYFILFEYIWSGSTPGKKSQNIRVIRSDGAPISFLEAAVRNILRVVDILADVYPLGLVVMFIDRRNRRLGDMAAGTLVVTETMPKVPSLQNAVVPPSDGDPELRRAVTEMTSEDYHLVRKFLARRETLSTEDREELAREIGSRVFNKSSLMTSPQHDIESLLERVETLYRERLRIL